MVDASLYAFCKSTQSINQSTSFGRRDCRSPRRSVEWHAVPGSYQALPALLLLSGARGSHLEERAGALCPLENKELRLRSAAWTG